MEMDEKEKQEKPKLKWFNAGEGIRYLEHQTRKHKGQPDRSYYIRLKVSGKTIQERVGWASKGMNVTKAKKIRDRLSVNYFNRTPPYTLKEEKALEEAKQQAKAEEEEGAVTIGDFFTGRYLPWAKEHKKTWDDDFLHFHKHLKPRFGENTFDAVSPFDVEKMKVEMKKSISKQGKPYSQATIKHQLVLLKRLYNLAKRWGIYAGANPMDRVEVPKLDNQRTEFLTDEELARLMETLDKWHNRDSVAFIKFALFTGLRRGELFKLTWGDIDFERGMVTLREPKGKKTQTLFISPQAIEILRELDRSSPYVFPGKGGQQRTDFKGPWLRIRQAAGLPENFRFHGLRHNFASRLVSAGYDLLVVGKLLTHKDAKTTQRYAHLSPGALKEAALNSGELLNPKVKQEAMAENGGRFKNEI
jgi:integrase